MGLAGAELWNPPTANRDIRYGSSFKYLPPRNAMTLLEKKLLETFQNILLGYGEKELGQLLRNAAEAIIERFRNNRGEEQKRTSNYNFYRHGQLFTPSSK